MTDDKKEKTRKFDGISLECDVLRKVAHQLDRLPTVAAKLRLAEFVVQAAAEDKTSVMKSGTPTGQLGLSVELPE